MSETKREREKNSTKSETWNPFPSPTYLPFLIIVIPKKNEDHVKNSHVAIKTNKIIDQSLCKYYIMLQQSE